jgi:hypothetical protein
LEWIHDSIVGGAAIEAVRIQGVVVAGIAAGSSIATRGGGHLAAQKKKMFDVMDCFIVFEEMIYI